MKILVTGAAGFIGMHTSLRLLARGDEVVGLDNLNDYYDPTLKEARLARLTSHAAFRFVKMDVADRAGMEALFAAEKFDRVAEPDFAFDALQPNPGTSNAPYRVFNIGNHDPVELMSFVGAIEDALGMAAEKNFLPLQDGDVPATSTRAPRTRCNRPFMLLQAASPADDAPSRRSRAPRHR